MYLREQIYHRHVCRIRINGLPQRYYRDGCRLRTRIFNRLAQKFHDEYSCVTDKQGAEARLYRGLLGLRNQIVSGDFEIYQDTFALHATASQNFTFLV